NVCDFREREPRSNCRIEILKCRTYLPQCFGITPKPRLTLLGAEDAEGVCGLAVHSIERKFNIAPTFLAAIRRRDEYLQSFTDLFGMGHLPAHLMGAGKLRKTIANGGGALVMFG